MNVTPGIASARVVRKPWRIVDILSSNQTEVQL
jgi:hypothetical protein